MDALSRHQQYSYMNLSHQLPLQPFEPPKVEEAVDFFMDLQIQKKYDRRREWIIYKKSELHI